MSHISHLQPALLFNFDRTDCEIMAQDLLHALQSAENSWREDNSTWARKVRDWEDWKSRAKERERQAERAKKVKKDQDSPAAPLQEHSWESTFDPDDPSPQFSFAGSHTSYSLVDLEKDIQGLSWNTSIQPWAFDALRRGIAVHHAGMNKQYRSLVERFVPCTVAAFAFVTFSQSFPYGLPTSGYCDRFVCDIYTNFTQPLTSCDRNARTWYQCPNQDFSFLR